MTSKSRGNVDQCSRRFKNGLPKVQRVIREEWVRRITIFVLHSADRIAQIAYCS